ncbi:hypothetical protein J6590_011724 [Homalodisca vitripennis]|nr:hypothetical protein J6590_011724 [Homalodisca vitripennis]
MRETGGPPHLKRSIEQKSLVLKPKHQLTREVIGNNPSLGVCTCAPSKSDLTYKQRASRWRRNRNQRRTDHALKDETMQNRLAPSAVRRTAPNAATKSMVGFKEALMPSGSGRNVEVNDSSSGPLESQVQHDIPGTFLEMVNMAELMWWPKYRGILEIHSHVIRETPVEYVVKSTLQGLTIMEGCNFNEQLDVVRKEDMLNVVDEDGEQEWSNDSKVCFHLTVATTEMASLYGSQTVISLLHRVLRILEEESALETDISKPVVQFKHPAELKKEQLFENLGPPATEDSLETVVRDVVRFSVKTQHPLFLNQLYGRVDEYGLAGAWITEALNTNQHTFEVAPVFTLVEMAVIERLLQVVGYGEGDGIFAAGESIE